MVHGALELWETSQGLPRVPGEGPRRGAWPQTSLSHSNQRRAALHPTLEFSMGVFIGVKKEILLKGGSFKPRVFHHMKSLWTASSMCRSMSACPLPYLLS